jgi:mediator of RNA polymerase II transcription subunit 12
MWTLRTLISHPGLDRFPSTALSLFDLAALLSDSISEDVRKQLSYRDAAKPVDDDRCTFIFGSTPPSDGWLILTQPVNAILHGQAEASSQAHLPTMNASPSQHGGQFQQTTGSGGLQRSSSQQQSSPAGQSPNFGRTFSHLGQGQKMAPQQLQRMGSNGQGGPSTQLQQMQQMQSLAQQRNMQASHSQQQRMPINQGQSPTTGKVANAKQSKVEMRHVPFTLNRWEVLPECGSNAMGNETAVSLSLFGARKV